MPQKHRLFTWLFSTWLIFSTQAQSIELQTGLNGTWHNPQQHGQGLVVQVAPDNDLLFVAWFTYTENSAKQMWLTAQGNLTSQPVNLTIYNTTGGKFDAADPAPQTVTWGNGQLQFHDCLNATFTYSGDSDGQINLTRITPPLNCVEEQP